MLAIKNNLMAENAARQLGKSYDALAKSVERLSSGLRINSAKDDAAGLAVRELIRADVATLKQGSRNARDAISMLQAAEGGLAQMDEILIRMGELAEQAATGTYSSDQITIMQNEFDGLKSEITRIAQNQNFNGVNMLTSDSDTAKITLGNGVDSTKSISVSSHDMTGAGLALTGTKEFVTGRGVSTGSANYFTGGVGDGTITFDFTGGNSITLNLTAATSKTLDTVVTDLNTAAAAVHADWVAASSVYNGNTGQYVLKVENYVTGDEVMAVSVTAAPIWAAGLGGDTVALADFVNVDGTSALTLGDGTDAAKNAVTAAIAEKDSYRATLGYLMNRLEAASGVIDIQAQNLMTAESRISDVDVATEMAAMTRNQVLSQAGISMLAQANTMPQMALTLLRG